VTELLCSAAGGPQGYSGRTMEDSQRHLAITPSEWDAFIDDVETTLDKFSVPAAELDCAALSANSPTQRVVMVR